MFAIFARIAHFLFLPLSLVLSVFAPAADAPKKVFRPAFRDQRFAAQVSRIINGGMTERTADKITDPLHARCLVLDDGTAKVAIVVVDSCMMPRDLLDEAKQVASRATRYSDQPHADLGYAHAFGPERSWRVWAATRMKNTPAFWHHEIAKGIIEADNRLEPARIGWAFGEDKKDVACRHWIMKPGISADESLRRDEGRCGPNESGAEQNVRRHPPHRYARSGGSRRFDSDARRQSRWRFTAAYSLHYVGKTTARFGRLLRRILRRHRQAAARWSTSHLHGRLGERNQRRYLADGLFAAQTARVFAAKRCQRCGRCGDGSLQPHRVLRLGADRDGRIALGMRRADAECRRNCRGQGVHEDVRRARNRKMCRRSMPAKR